MHPITTWYLRSGHPKRMETCNMRQWLSADIGYGPEIGVGLVRLCRFDQMEGRAGTLTFYGVFTDSSHFHYALKIRRVSTSGKWTIPVISWMIEHYVVALERIWNEQDRRNICSRCLLLCFVSRVCAMGDIEVVSQQSHFSIINAVTLLMCTYGDRSMRRLK